MAPNQLPPALLQRCPEVFANGICLVLPIYSKGKDMAALFREADWGRYNFNAVQRDGWVPAFCKGVPMILSAAEISDTISAILAQHKTCPSGLAWNAGAAWCRVRGRPRLRSACLLALAAD